MGHEELSDFKCGTVTCGRHLCHESFLEIPALVNCQCYYCEVEVLINNSSTTKWWTTQTLQHLLGLLCCLTVK